MKNKFRERFNGLGITVAHLARESGVDRHTVRAVLENDNPLIGKMKYGTLLGFSLFFGCEIEDLRSADDAGEVPMMMRGEIQRLKAIISRNGISSIDGASVH